jgi:hypothetical protein
MELQAEGLATSLLMLRSDFPSVPASERPGTTHARTMDIASDHGHERRFKRGPLGCAASMPALGSLACPDADTDRHLWESNAIERRWSGWAGTERSRPFSSRNSDPGTGTDSCCLHFIEWTIVTARP